MHCSPGKIALIWVKFLVNATNTVRVALHRTQCGAACGSFFCRVRFKFPTPERLRHDQKP
jgi:hypothetical protein